MKTDGKNFSSVFIVYYIAKYNIHLYTPNNNETY